ncbi:MAG: DNA polymerase III subunit gamma/tau [Rhodospirillales bacterium]|nr:DNA polymerase III subunit gamma/tau [Rhodospirillales bacterium]
MPVSCRQPYAPPAAHCGPKDADAPMSEDAAAYRVLARKYRPASFAGLIGQDPLVQTLSNAIAMDRLAHAWLLTGVRGVGKTSTARIIARALNCVGEDGSGGPTPEPCGACDHCVSIAEDRHVDVIEMDAASRTGIDDVRELIESVRYRPVSARYKVYIIDEVHMLSKQAFNALLKTLEEPPPHVKFVFATTEVRRLPVTVLSRCQRFDLRRVDMEVLIEHFSAIAANEGAEVEPAALALIARAADGSVRDGLSVLDQAMAHEGTDITEEAVRGMLGFADRTRLFDLFDMLMKGAIKDALDCFSELHDAGAEPQALLQDLLELCHWLTRLKHVPAAADDPAVPEAERTRGRAMAEALPVPSLTQTWQMLLKGLEEANRAARPALAAEMTLVRIAYAADLPSPADALRAIGVDGSRGRAKDAPEPSAPTTAPRSAATAGAAADPAPAPAPAPDPARASAPQPRLDSLAAIAALAEERREPILSAWLRTEVRAVRIGAGAVEINCGRSPDGRMLDLLRDRLQEWTGERWMIALTDDGGEPTLEEQERVVQEAADKAAMDHPLVQQVLDAFPGARVRKVHRTTTPSPLGGGNDGDSPS